LKTSTPFAELPDAARLWVFAAQHPLHRDDADAVLARVDAFLAEWHAHGHPVVGARELLYDRFLLVAADEEATGVSGCSIDSLFRVLKDVERNLGLSLLDSSLVFYRDENDVVRSATRAEFRQMVGAGEVRGDSTVFDNTVSSIAALRGGAWERPMRESWHGRAFATG
jgi:hypothetical protein